MRECAPTGRLVYTRLQRLHRHGPSPDCQLGLHATRDCEIDYGTPESIEGLAEHSLIFYVESLLRVEDLDLLTRITGDHRVAFGSTSVQVQIATLAGAGIGLLPAFVDDREPMLHRVLPAEVAPVLEFTAWLAPKRLRRPAAATVLQAIRETVAERREKLMPEW
jgi:hypothetical protein